MRSASSLKLSVVRARVRLCRAELACMIRRDVRGRPQRRRCCCTIVITHCWFSADSQICWVLRHHHHPSLINRRSLRDYADTSPYEPAAGQSAGNLLSTSLGQSSITGSSGFLA